MLIVQNVTYIHPDKELLFEHISFSVPSHAKVALIGNNGSGKSTMLKLISAELSPTSGQIATLAKPYYIPQIFGQYDHLRVADALQVAGKLKAFTEILAGEATEENMLLLDDDWTIEDRVNTALSYWALDGLDPFQTLATLSGGQKTKVFLAGLMIHQPELILLDEPSNHLDANSRQLLYYYLSNTTATLLIVSHDRELLNLLNSTYELSKKGVTTYGGNYDFYAEQKQIEHQALAHSIQSQEKELRKAKEKERETIERQNRLDARGKKKQEKAGVARIMMNTMRNNAENSTARTKAVHTDKIMGINEELTSLRRSRSEIDKMKFGFEESKLHQGKILVSLEAVNHSFGEQQLWAEPITWQLRSGDRVAIRGDNGSGKTTFVKIMLGQILPQSGTVQNNVAHAVYIDQDYSLIDNSLSVYEQAQAYNNGGLQEHDIKIRLNRFLFDSEAWNKPCSTLSGGERMRLALCCLTVQKEAPDLIVLDEPTNNLDIQNIEILTKAISEYQGSLLLISHDAHFRADVGAHSELLL